MALTISPELEGRIQRKAVAEGYRDVDQLIESALNLLDEMNGGMTLSEIRAKIDKGWEAAERGDTISGEEYEAEMDQWRAKVNATI